MRKEEEIYEKEMRKEERIEERRNDPYQLKFN